MSEQALDPICGRTALITGADSGIGRATALTLAARGVRVFVTGRDHKRLEDTIEALVKMPNGASLFAGSMAADLSEPGNAHELTDKAHYALRTLSVLVHAAGIYWRSSPEKTCLSNTDAIYRASVSVPRELTRAALSHLAHSQGQVVLINSTHGSTTSAEVPAYAVSQQATRALNENLRAEVNSRGIRMTTINLDRTTTSRQKRILASDGRDRSPEFRALPATVANVVLTAVSLPQDAQLTSVTVGDA